MDYLPTQDELTNYLIEQRELLEQDKKTLEENGFNISGGERQRIILARALLKKSSIYILDESLSQVDVTKEREILENIFEENKDKTIIYISHRFDNKDLFSKSINMENLLHA